jgi:hypothetical protein
VVWWWLTLKSKVQVAGGNELRAWGVGLAFRGFREQESKAREAEAYEVLSSRTSREHPDSQ